MIQSTQLDKAIVWKLWFGWKDRKYDSCGSVRFVSEVCQWGFPLFFAQFDCCWCCFDWLKFANFCHLKTELITRNFSCCLMDKKVSHAHDNCNFYWSKVHIVCSVNTDVQTCNRLVGCESVFDFQPLSSAALSCFWHVNPLRHLPHDGESPWNLKYDLHHCIVLLHTTLGYPTKWCKWCRLSSECDSNNWIHHHAGLCSRPWAISQGGDLQVGVGTIPIVCIVGIVQLAELWYQWRYVHIFHFFKTMLLVPRHVGWTILGFRHSYQHSDVSWHDHGRTFPCPCKQKNESAQKAQTLWYHTHTNRISPLKCCTTVAERGSKDNQANPFFLRRLLTWLHTLTVVESCSSNAKPEGRRGSKLQKKMQYFMVQHYQMIPCGQPHVYTSIHIQIDEN